MPCWEGDSSADPGWAEGAGRLHDRDRKKSPIQGGTGEARMLQRMMEGALWLFARTERSRRLKAETEGARWLQADRKGAQRLQTEGYDAVPGGQIRLQNPEN